MAVAPTESANVGIQELLRLSLGCLGAMRAGPEAVSAYLKTAIVSRATGSQWSIPSGGREAQSEHLQQWDLQEHLSVYLLPEGSCS